MQLQVVGTDDIGIGVDVSPKRNLMNQPVTAPKIATG